MFFKALVLFGLLAVVLCAEEPVAIVSQNADIQPDGSFQWSFESGDGTKQDQSGAIKQVGNDETVSSIQGSVTWRDPEGNEHQITYVADERGFQPQGADIPVPPEIPSQIARALEYLAAHPQQEEQA